ncbi:BTAD domain-containing putative transcriptional regulator [Actinomycetes bacterium KLBMP 9797]
MTGTSTNGDGLAVEVLGPLAVSVDGRPVAVAGRLRAMLATLAMSAGEDVSIERLASGVWGDELPSDVRRTVQVYVTRLRRVIGAQAIRTTPGGYRLEVDPDRVDAARFVRMLDIARSAADPAAERAQLARALTLWRGTPFDGVRSSWLDSAVAPRLVERRVDAWERRIELDLAAGGGEELVAELRELTARHPLRERLWGHLMTALYRAGRQADALQAYQRLYRILTEDIGVEPGQAIRELHHKILSADPTLEVTADHPVSDLDPPRGPQPVSLLPRTVADFTGRTAEGDRLVAALTAVRPATTVCGIDGMAGVGKSTLAVHIAHQVSGSYPDALLFVDMHGHLAGRTPRTAADTLDHLLRVMGVPADRVPEELDERVARWRTLTMGKRILLLLDDVVDAEQVRPAIPGGAGCSVVITSRRRLTDLDLTHVLSLDPMPASEATMLFRQASGVPAGDPGVAHVVDLCAGLPLAIWIAATRLRHRPAWNAVELAGRLRDEHRRLPELTVGDRGVAAAFTLSYRCLTTPQQRVFRALGVHPGQQVDARSVAASCALPVTATQPLLEDLVDAHLLAQPATGRYRLHDLLRVFASEQAARHPAERDATLRRVLDYYVAAADAADRRAYPHRPRLDMPTAPDSVPTFGSAGEALRWFDAELNAIAAATNLAYERGLDEYAWRIPVAAWGLFCLRSQWTEWIDSHQTAIAAAERVGDKVALGQVLGGLGVAMQETGAYDAAAACYRRAIELRRDTGDVRGEANNLGNIAVVYAEMGQYEEAIDCAKLAAYLSRSSGDLARLAPVLNNLGEMRRRVGQFDDAVADLEEARAIARQVSSSRSEAIALGYLAAVHNDMKDFERAAALGQHALELLGQTNDRLRIADVLVALGHAARGLGDTYGARQHWQRSFEILTDLGHARASEVKELLASLRAAP